MEVAASLALLSTFVVLLVIGIPVAYSMAMSSIVALLLWDAVPLVVVPQTMLTGVNAWSYLAIPFFILAGMLMSNGGMTRRLIDFSLAIVGAMPGGLSHASVVSNMIMAGMSGSDLADAAATGTVLIPEMKRRGYPAGYAAAIVAGAATVAPLIPPSIAFIIFATVADLSVIRLFLAGAVPGVLLGTLLIGMGFIVAIRRDFPRERLVSPKVFVHRLIVALPALAMPVLIVGGILGGYFTATEASAVAVLYAVLVGAFVYRELTWDGFWRAIDQTVRTSAAILFIIAAAALFAWLITVFRVGPELAVAVTTMSDNPIVLLLLLNIFLLMLGTTMDSVPAMLIFTPIFLPAATELGVDPYHLGVIVVFNLLIGLITPPHGLTMFLVSRIAGIPVSEFIRSVGPVFLTLIVTLLLVTLVPEIVLWLPNLVLGKP